MEPIRYSKFVMYRVDDADMDGGPTFPFPFVDGSEFRAVNVGIGEPAVQVNFEDVLPGPEIPWTLFHDELQYLTSGRAESSTGCRPSCRSTARWSSSPAAST